MAAATTIGVVMSVLDGSALIDQTLASVAGQSRLPDQVVAVDDGSSDDTAERMEAWSDRLPITVLRHPETRGLCAGKNAAFAALTTDLVVPLDGDDIWLPDHLEVLGDRFDRRGGIVSPGVLRWFPNLGIAESSVRSPRPVPESDQLDRLIRNNFVFSGSLFSREDGMRIGGPDGPWRPFGPSVDWDLWLRMVRAGVRLTVIPHPTVLYRLHDGSMSAGGRALPSAIDVLEAFRSVEPDSHLRSVADQSLRDHRARLRLEEAYALALDGHPWAARRRLWRAVGAGGRTLRNSVAMSIAPTRVAGLRAGSRYRLR